MKKVLIGISVFCTMFLFSKLYSQVENEVGEGQEYEATNCKHTGNSSDFCYASNGSSNVKVLECKPGTTDCNYQL